MQWKFSTGKRLEAESAVAGKLRAASKFYRFLWEIRAELFDEAFQRELAAAYDPRGQEPCPPALLAMVNLLQRYEGLSDADAVDAAENDRRWQLVLGCLGNERAPFGQGSLVRFRVRMIEHDLDKKLVDRTIELAKRTGKFGWQRLRVALDSSPLRGAGRVEDTWNLVGRAMGKVVAAVSVALSMDNEHVISAAGLTLLQADSIKAALDIDWTDDNAQHEALQLLVEQATALETWVQQHARTKVEQPPLSTELALLRRLMAQDLEPDPDGGGLRIRDGVAADRVISVSDREMRHGRKSRSTRFDGYKRHVAIANRLILATAVAPANRQEHAAVEPLLASASRHGTLAALDIDRGYLASPAIADLCARGIAVRSRAWRGSNRGFFLKEDFHIDLAGGVITCPAQVQARITSDSVRFAPEHCGRCQLKPYCTDSPSRSIKLNPIEPLLIDLRRAQASTAGRAELRQRIPVEHKLARLGSIQGTKARYAGARKNELDVNRAAAIVNLHEYAQLRATPTAAAA
jgi:Transposase DDE domain/Transposase domain (DUF772)